MMQMESKTESVKMSWRKEFLRSRTEDKMMYMVMRLPVKSKYIK